MSQKIHIRRCHVCGEINEATGHLVNQCSQCGKTLAPFFYFDESRVMGLAPKTSKKDGASRLPRNEYPPLWGLTAYWENSYEGGTV